MSACRIWVPAALLALAAGCAALHPPPPATAELATRAPLVAEAAPVADWPGATWWRAYHDPVLDRLVETAIAAAPDLAAADARIARAREQVGVTGATLGLTARAEASYTRQRLSDNGLFPPEFLGFHWYDQSDLGVSLHYQFDWWGKQRATLQGAIDRARALSAEREAAVMVLAASVTATYFGWQADSAQLDLQQQAVTLQQDALQIAQRRVAADLEPADAEIRAAAALAAQRETLALLEGSRQLRRVTLAALLGVDASALPRLVPQPLPAASAGLPQDAGTNLLARRADIAASRWRVEAALRDTDVERANFYPDIAINALAGLSSIELGRLLRADSAAPRIGLAVDLPLFESGLRRARHRTAMAGLDLAIAEYEQAIVNAAREAGAAAASLQQARTQRAHRAAQLAAAAELTARADARLERGIISRGPQLAARLAEIEQRERLVQIDLATLLADVQLRQALGGEPAPGKPTP